MLLDRLRLDATELAMQHLKKEELADRAAFGIAKGDRVVVLQNSSDYRYVLMTTEVLFLCGFLLNDGWICVYYAVGVQF